MPHNCVGTSLKHFCLRS